MEPDLEEPGSATPGRPWERFAPWLLAAFMLAPSVYWVARDSSVWSWDPAFYAEGTVDLWFKLVRRPAQWPQALLAVLSPKAPGLAWLGQLFVPVGQLLGSIEFGLLASVLLVQLGTLVLTFRTARAIAPGSALPAVMATLFIGASPLFVSMSHHYLTEALQAFAISYLYWAAAVAPLRPPLRTLSHLILATSIGILAKVSTPAFIVFPGLLAAYHAVKGFVRPRMVLRPRPGELARGLPAALLMVMGMAWYLRNWGATLAFAELAASSDVALDYGRRDTALNKLVYWMGALRRSFLATETTWLLLVVSLTALVVFVVGLRWRRGVTGGFSKSPLLFAALLQVGAVFLMLSFTVNEETRYLLALAPSIAVVLAWLVTGLRGSPYVGWALCAALVGQWAVVHGRSLGVIETPGRNYWEGPPVEARALKREISRLAEHTCPARTAGQFVMTGVDLDWLNLNTLSFYSAKAQLERGLRCQYVYLGHAEKDANVAWGRLAYYKVPYFISLEESAMPVPPDFLNRVSLPVLKRIEAAPEFARESFDSEFHVVVFRRLSETPLSR